ncbi:copine-3 [Elysia marginata]|uniref:Copine-3 n=1 Tax=Elysia marginata TaxID=1093978 RepID=A0AAV4J435_9GAST|nr:copine-3 [Elysia marginata]
MAFPQAVYPGYGSAGVMQAPVQKYARTENARNTLDPNFTKAITVDYHFEAVQHIRVRVYDIDNSTEKLGDDDFLGQMECTLGQVVSRSPFSKPLTKKKGDLIPGCGITITAEELKEGCEVAMMKFGAKKLDNKDFMGKSDPFLEISRVQSDGTWQVVHRTEVVKNDLSPEWRPFTLPIHSLFGRQRDQPIKIQREYSFLDYIFGGLQMNLTFGIDFTASNGHPGAPTSLHFIDYQHPNEYMQAISAVGNVLQDYDFDKMFPALGFGAKIPPHMVESFEFALNFNASNPFCAGVQGVLNAYVNCVTNIQLWGPTNVSPIINHVARFAKAAQDGELQGRGASAYYILLLLTDGVLSDMDYVRDALVQASYLPMSLIIVGVGMADFKDMNMLDGDDGVLKSTRGQPVQRDIVQFVPFRDFKQRSPAELACHVLAEIPKQVTGYFRMRGLPPNQPPAAAPPPSQ